MTLLIAVQHTKKHTPVRRIDVSEKIQGKFPITVRQWTEEERIHYMSLPKPRGEAIHIPFPQLAKGNPKYMKGRTK